MVLMAYSNGSWGTSTCQTQMTTGKTESPATGAEKAWHSTGATATMVTAPKKQVWAVLATSETRKLAVTTKLTGLDCAIMMQLSEELSCFLEILTVKLQLAASIQTPTQHLQHFTLRMICTSTTLRMTILARSWFHMATVSSYGRTMASKNHLESLMVPSFLMNMKKWSASTLQTLNLMTRPAPSRSTEPITEGRPAAIGTLSPRLPIPPSTILSV